MNRIDRLTAMILMLQSFRVITAAKISAHFEISERTVYRDIASLGEAGVPIISEAGVGYSLMHGYHMPPVMFTEKEAAALFMSGEIAEKFGDYSLKKALSGALLKVRAVLPDAQQNYLSRLGKSFEVWVRPNGVQDGQSLMPLQEAVVRKRCIRIEYDTGGKGKLTDRTVEPLGLMHYGRQWHLIAWCRLRADIRDFRIDRMQNWEVLDSTFSGHEDFSLQHFLHHEAEEYALTPVQIECEKWVLERILYEMPGEIISKTELPGGRFRIDARTCSIEWTARWFIGLGTAAIAQGPAEFRDLIAAQADKIAQSYRLIGP